MLIARIKFIVVFLENICAVLLYNANSKGSSPIKAAGIEPRLLVVDNVRGVGESIVNRGAHFVADSCQRLPTPFRRPRPRSGVAVGGSDHFNLILIDFSGAFGSV
jgi:hypothetical protein